MDRYALRRILLVVPTVIGMSLLAFGISHAAPGDPALERFRIAEGRSPTTAELATERRELHLDEPFVRQYARWAGGILDGDLGRSFTTGRGVAEELRLRLPATLQLALAGALLALVLAVPAGVLAALRHNRMGDHVLRLTSLAAASVPSFWLALILIEVFAVRLPLAPVGGRAGLDSVLLPAAAVAAGPAAVLARFTRAAVLETLGEEHIRAARAKGVTETGVVLRHGLRTSLVPLLTAAGTAVGHLLAGSVIVERIFRWPGMGDLAVGAIQGRDYPVIQGVVLTVGLTFVAINLVVDLSYAAVDPRVRLGASARPA